MIYKVLVVDDEPYIVNWLSQMLLSCTEYNLKVYKADSSKKALKIMELQLIDILLTDIKMPGLNGVELSKIVKDKYPECKMIFLSAYSDFEYAKEALSSGVVEYVLKTQSDEKILDSISKCINQINKEKMSKQLIEKADKSIKSLMPYYRFRTLQVMYNLELMLEFDIIKERFDEVGININPYKEFYAVICRIDSNKNEDYLSVEENINKSIVVHDLLCEKTQNVLNLAVFHLHKSAKKYIYILLQEIEENHKNIREYISKIIVDIQSTVNAMLSIDTSYAFSGIKTDFTKWKRTFNRLEILLQSHNNQTSKVFFDNVNVEMDGNIRKENNAILSKVRKYLEAGDYKNCMKKVKKEYFNSSEDKEKVYNNIMLLTEYIMKSNCNGTDKNKIKKYEEFNNSLLAYEYLDKKISYLCEYINKVNENTTVDLVNRIKVYIEKNIFENLSLEEMAEDMYYNPSYLSRIFRNETGITLKTYVDEIRVEKIKKLLENENIMIKDIASKLNFNGPAYFSSFFKKHTGMNPNDYRRKNKK